jgi:predicted phosphoadenosine phosphosulfate sulfurtransferase
VPEHEHPAGFRRAVVALNGGSTDSLILRLAIELGRPTKAELVAVHVVEIDWTLPLDADIAGRSEEVQRVLDVAEGRVKDARQTIRRTGV